VLISPRLGSESDVGHGSGIVVLVLQGHPLIFKVLMTILRDRTNHMDGERLVRPQN